MPTKDPNSAALRSNPVVKKQARRRSVAHLHKTQKAANNPIGDPPQPRQSHQGSLASNPSLADTNQDDEELLANEVLY